MNPLILFLLLFVGAPLVELYFLIEVGARIGAIPTVFLTVFTAVLGGLLVRMQGFSTALRVKAALDRGEVPAVEMLEGMVLLLTGILLLLPGFLTDALGFLALVPQARRRMIIALLRRAQVLHPATGEAQEAGRVYEGEFRRHEEERLK
ncbi:MAG: FxsA family protein [gamma proteobacterium symbiont of Phacoides pectinatus]